MDSSSVMLPQYSGDVEATMSRRASTFEADFYVVS